ncbi:M20/M25/M40 family metallo-hydrolase [Jatrophihabitans sp.]|uniref:M20/M25/M40 family metallo-hydrolase n=1 Tax=Jatrophihabitans sp. TaxID=1932789 RepID=UPI002EE1A2E5
MSSPASQDVLALTAELVGLDSVNPSLVPDAPGEHAIAAFVRDWATGCGLSAQTVHGPDGRPSVIVRGGRGGSGSAGWGGRTLLLCGHLDTVGHGSRQASPAAVVEGRRLYGRGSYDMKAGLAAALVACRDAAAAGISGQVVVAAVADEEHSSTGIQTVLNHVWADAAVVTEPTELEVAVAHKGFVWTGIEVIGRAAHGSRPHLGINAITHTGGVLAAVSELDRELASRPPHPLLGHSTVHASLISGGSGESTIPELCTLTLERRTLPGQSVEEAEADIAGLLDRCGRDQPGLSTRTRTLLARQPLETNADEPVVAMMLDAATRSDGRPRVPAGLSYWADSALIAAAGIPTVLFGPSGDGAHADIEWVDLDSVLSCTRALTILACEFAA